MSHTDVYLLGSISIGLASQDLQLELTLVRWN